VLVCVSHFDVVRNVESQEMINETGEKMDEKVHFFFRRISYDQMLLIFGKKLLRRLLKARLSNSFFILPLRNYIDFFL
jgi:c-di-AMP phosphodiesterase-like protein